MDANFFASSLKSILSSATKLYINWFLSSVKYAPIKFINKLTKKQEKKEEAKAPVKSDEVLLLEEIRDLMKKDIKKTTKTK